VYNNMSRQSKSKNYNILQAEIRAGTCCQAGDYKLHRSCLIVPQELLQG